MVHISWHNNYYGPLGLLIWTTYIGIFANWVGRPNSFNAFMSSSWVASICWNCHDTPIKKHSNTRYSIIFSKKIESNVTCKFRKIIYENYLFQHISDAHLACATPYHIFYTTFTTHKAISCSRIKTVGGLQNLRSFFRAFMPFLFPLSAWSSLKFYLSLRISL